MPNYVMQCPVCGQESKAHKIGNRLDYMCLTCYAVSQQDGNLSVYDIDEKEMYKREFLGAKKAGLIHDSGYDGFLEQIEREK